VKGIYSDLLLYNLEDPAPQGQGSYGEPPPQLQLPTRSPDEPRPEEWKTPALWGVADSAPYLHDGSAPTLRDAIQRHRGDAKSVLEKYLALSPADQANVVSFLGTLKAPPDSAKLPDLSITRLSRK
jgi:cytochrome c peroxidase